jgi:hypothetical protein
MMDEILMAVDELSILSLKLVFSSGSSQTNFKLYYVFGDGIVV